MFTYTGGNKAKTGFLDAIVLVMETGFVITAFVSIFLNLIIPFEVEEEETEGLAGDYQGQEDAELRALDENSLKSSAQPTKGGSGDASVERRVLYNLKEI